MSNGSSDVHMSGVEVTNTSHLAQMGSQGMNPPQWRGISHGASNLSSFPTGINTQSQTSAFQQIPHDTSPSALINDASTTTSGKKTSQSDGLSTQVTNGKPDSQYSPPDRESQLPDTQRGSQEGTQAGSSSDDQWPHSQAHAIARGHMPQAYPSQSPTSGSQPSSQHVHRFEAPPPKSKSTAALANILNDPAEPPSSQTSSQKDIILDENFVNGLLETFTMKSSGCSIEQLEQVNRELMNTLWEMRGEYNRTKVGTKLLAVFNEAITDIESMQKVLQPSQD
jgi:hypothetical protein